MGGRWGAQLDAGLLGDVQKYRRYNVASLRDLLRVIRNKYNHFGELPEDIKAKLQPLPDGFYAYFAAKFPNLLLTCYRFALVHLAGEECTQLKQFFCTGSPKEFPFAPLPQPTEVTLAGLGPPPPSMEEAGEDGKKKSFGQLRGRGPGSGSRGAPGIGPRGGGHLSPSASRWGPHDGGRAWRPIDNLDTWRRTS